MIKTYLFTAEDLKEDVSPEEWRRAAEDKDALLWVDVRSYDAAEIRHLADVFGFHSVAVDSCMDTYRRPHLYEFHDHFYANLTLLPPNHRGHEAKPTELHMFVGEKYIVTAVRREENDVTEKALEVYKDTPASCRRGPLYAVYLLAEDLVETYYPIVEKLDDEADKLESRMLDRPEKQSLNKLFSLKRRNNELRKLFGPQRDLFSELARRDFPFIRGEDKVYSQDLFNRMNRIFDMLDTIREILSGTLDIYLSGVSNRLNEVMKVLTVAATILGVLTFVTGFFGMNFVHLPWLNAPNAFRNINFFMFGTVIVMLALFKWKKWL